MVDNYRYISSSILHFIFFTIYNLLDYRSQFLLILRYLIEFLFSKKIETDFKKLSNVDLYAI